ncbi:hypothetical protein [Streptosporangium canum]
MPAELDRLGMSGVRRAVPVVARVPRVSRSTVRTLLSDLRITP